MSCSSIKTETSHSTHTEMCGPHGVTGLDVISQRRDEQANFDCGHASGHNLADCPFPVPAHGAGQRGVLQQRSGIHSFQKDNRWMRSRWLAARRRRGTTTTPTRHQRMHTISLYLGTSTALSPHLRASGTGLTRASIGDAINCSALFLTD